MNSTSSKSPNLRLKRERESHGWSQEDLAEKIGTTQKIVSRWERGESRPLPYYRQKLIKLFGKDATELGLTEIGPSKILGPMGDTLTELLQPRPPLDW